MSAAAKRAPIVYTEATPPPLARGAVRDIWARLAARLPSFRLWWDGETFRAEAEGRVCEISQHIAIAVDQISEQWPRTLNDGASPAVAEVAAALGRGWLTLQQVASTLQIERSAAQKRLKRAEALGLVEGRPVAGHAHRQRPAREWRAKAVAP